MAALELKTCELCGKSFPREVHPEGFRSNEVRECPTCQANNPFPAEDERPTTVAMSYLLRLIQVGVALQEIEPPQPATKPPAPPPRSPQRRHRAYRSPWEPQYPGESRTSNRFDGLLDEYGKPLHTETGC